MNANTMKWLLKREFWEYKGSMFWAPLVVAALLVLLVGGGIVYAVSVHGAPAYVSINGHTMSGGKLSGMPVETRAMVANMAGGMVLAAAAPLFMLLAFVVFFYCLGSLYNERRDRSILFWKSLPVSDPQAVAAKAATAMLVAPVITIVLATLASFALLFVIGAALGAHGVNVFSAALASQDFFLTPLRLAALLPVYVVWALPTVGWLMLVSSWAKSKPFLWAVGVPVMANAVVKSINAVMENVSGQTLLLAHWVSDIVARILGGVVPGIWFTFPGHQPTAVHPGMNGIEMGGLVPQSYASLAGADAWIGALLGIGMLLAAVRLRRWRDEA
jgi:ABC-2 type transport system permease protein